MAIQYGPRSLPLRPVRSGFGTAGTGAGFAPAFSRSGAAAAPYHPVAPVAARRRSQTTSQVANQRVGAVLNPQIAAQQAFANRQNAVIQQFAQALLGKLQPIAGQVGAEYDQAANAVNAYGQGAANFLQAQNPSGPVADLLRSANAPQSQIDQVTGQLGQTFGGGAGVLAYTGGAIPAANLQADRAAAVGQAAQLPGLAALQGQRDLASALWQQGQDMRDIQAQRPGLYQQAVQDITQNNIARQRNALTARQDALQNQHWQQTFDENRHQFDVTRQDKANAAADAEQKANVKTFLSLYFNTLSKGTYSDDQIASIAKAYGVPGDFTGMGTTAPPDAHPTVRQTDQGLAQYDPQTGSWTIVPGTAPAPKVNKPIVVSDKTGQYLVDSTTGERISRIGGPKGSSTAVTTKTIKVPGGTALINSKTGAVIATYKGPKTGASSTGRKVSTSDIASLQDDINTWHTGTYHTEDGKRVLDEGSKKSWMEAYKAAVPQVGAKQAAKQVTAIYGSPVEIATANARSGKSDGLGLTDSLKLVVQHYQAGDLAVPLKAAINGHARAYGVKPSDVVSILRELALLPEDLLNPPEVPGG